MSKMTKSVIDGRSESVYAKDMANKKATTNYMGGISYEVNPLLTLKMLTASSIFAEPQYYRDGAFAEKGVTKDAHNKLDALFADYAVLLTELSKSPKTTSRIMEEAIDAALDYDFAQTLDWAVTLRKEFNMRLNPQVIMVRAALHKNRAVYTSKYPGMFDYIEQLVMSRADEPASQLTYYLFKNGSVKNLPNLLKKSWAKRIGNMSRYEFGKYKNKGLGLIDVVRVSHAKGELVDELMKTGTVVTTDDEKTWEGLKAQGKTWEEILHSLKVPHMALLRNLRGIYLEVTDKQLLDSVLDNLKKGVKHGKQFPFAYKTASSVIAKAEIAKPLLADIDAALNDCLELATEEMPHLKGKTACLSDNSGSAHGAFTSEFGSVNVSQIDNLSSVITAKNSDEGYVGIFGDDLKMIPVSKDSKVLEKAKEADKIGAGIGLGTENGIWMFFDKALRDKEHWDNIFIYSDMQAGHGGLYGLNAASYAEFQTRGHYIDVAKLIDVYRKKVNPKVNVFCVQTAGYTNVAVPEYGYRTNILYGWTGKELLFAQRMIELWDEYDAQAPK